MKKRCGVLLIGMILSLAATALVPGMATAATPMPSFDLQDVRNGRTVNSGVFKGKVLLLTFFATWCRPCRCRLFGGWHVG